MTGINEEAESAGDVEPERNSRETRVGAFAGRASRAEDLAERVTALEAEIEILRECIRQQSRMPLSPDEGQTLPTTAQVTADCQLEAEDGFHEMEGDVEARPYRWTGPSRLFGVDVILDRRQPRKLTVEVAASLAMENVDGLRAFCGAEELAVMRVAPAGSRLRSLSARIPARPPGGCVRLWFAVPRVVTPRDVDPESTDARPLGIAFVALRVQ